jgi:hypothetical protein
MDAKIALAMMAKAKLVFEQPDTFLSFPLTPKAYTKQQLNFMTGAESGNEGLLNLSEFSRLVNRIPGSSVWEDIEERYLWDLYDEVLKTAKLAISTRSPAEESDYAKALQFLYLQNPDGTRSDQPVVIAYNQFKDAWYLAQQSYNNQKIDAELSTDVAVQRRWKEVQEPLLRSQIQTIEQRWVAEGYKIQVEDARRIQTILGSKSPSQTWAQWQSLFNRDIDTKTDTNQMRFAITGFVPSNAIESAWQQFTLSEGEVNALINQAPIEIRNRLQPNAVDLDIESMSFEFTSVAITRSWFSSEAFKARFWQFYDSTKQLSDGQIPARGACPGYVAALVFARNPVVTLKANSEKNKQTLERIKDLDSISLGSVKVKVKDIYPGYQTPPIVVKQPVPIDIRPLPTDRITKVPPIATKLPPISTRIGKMANLRAASEPSIALDPRIPIDSRMSDIAIAKRMARLNETTFKRIPIPISDKLPTPRPIPPSNSNEVYIMGFICKRLPLCPNPDLLLQWNS